MTFCITVGFRGSLSHLDGSALLLCHCAQLRRGHYSVDGTGARLHVPHRSRCGDQWPENVQMQPELKRINDEYKDDMQKRAAAMQELYKKHNFKPLFRLLASSYTVANLDRPLSLLECGYLVASRATDSRLGVV